MSYGKRKITGIRVKVNKLRGERFRAENRLMAQPKAMLGGPLIKMFGPCGNPNCRCKKKGAKGHGPYYYVQVKRPDGKYTHKYLGKDQNAIQLASNYSEYLKNITLLRRLNREIDTLLNDLSRSEIKRGGKYHG
ncbi:MAG: DUF6788 family protein [Candidatus Margulisiibacteriota bacterium]